jgi:hypothetical protein
MTSIILPLVIGLSTGLVFSFLFMASSLPTTLNIVLGILLAIIKTKVLGGIAPLTLPNMPVIAEIFNTVIFVALVLLVLGIVRNLLIKIKLKTASE